MFKTACISVYVQDRYDRQTCRGGHVKLGMFSPTSILTSNDYEGLLRKIDEHFGFTEGFMFCASEFADVAPNWSIMFSLFSSNNASHNRVNTLKVVSNKKEFEAFDKTLYMIDKDKKASWWTKEPLEGMEKTRDVCYLKSAMNVTTSKPHNMCVKNSIGGFICSANNVNENTQFVALMSGMSSAAKGLNLARENFDRVVSLFAARRLISGDFATWINCKDEYMIPDTSNPKYEEWQNDSIVYSLFNTGSQQSSLRNIEYNGRTWDIQNEFFWMSSDIIEKLADGSLIKRLNDNRYQNSEVLDDLEKFGDHERYVYLRLKELKDNNKLSAEALAVLTKAEDLVLSSFKYRKDFNERHPEYQINTWDAGWYQIKGMLKDYDKEGLKEFNSLYDTLANKMRPLVYELGFLYK